MSTAGDDEQTSEALIEANRPDGGGVSRGAELIALATSVELSTDEEIDAFVMAGMPDGWTPSAQYPNEEHLTDDERASLDDCVVGSMREEVAARLPKMMIWSAEATAEEIAAHLLGK